MTFSRRIESAVLRARPIVSIITLVTVALAFFASCDTVHITTYYSQGVVASASPLASKVGEEVFRQGGNAYDAAVAVGFALAVTYPQAGNIGGGGFAVMRDAESGEVTSLDFREKAPLGATETMYLDDSGKVIPERSTYGVLAAGVPGTVAGLHELWEKHGTMPWEDLVGYAARLADSGFAVDSSLALRFKEFRKKLTGFESTTTVYYPEGQTLKAGDKLLLKDLATTLYAIAAEGPDVFYTGQVAEKIVATSVEHGGLITAEDLAAYQPVWRDPVRFTFDSLEIYSMSAPSSGGVILGQILKLVEPYDFAHYSPDAPSYIHLFAEAARLAFADRAVHLGDPDFYDVPSSMLDSSYLAIRRKTIDLEKSGDSKDVAAGNPAKYESDETTHFCVCDRAGNMVSITTTLNGSFGSKLVVAGAGFLLNNEMDDFSVKPGHPNQFGLVGAEANKIEPGKRMLSSMSPTIILLRGKPFMLLGAPGGSKIITTVAQAILNYTRFGMTLPETVAYPRFHHQWLPDVVYFEKGAFDPEIVKAVESYGHTVKDRPPYSNLQMVFIGPSGLMAGASDPRGSGAASGY